MEPTNPSKHYKAPNLDSKNCKEIDVVFCQFPISYQPQKPMQYNCSWKYREYYRHIQKTLPTNFICWQLL